MMKKAIFTAMAVLVLPTMASAQSNTSSVQATATVQDYINVTGTGDLAFGNLSRTAANTVSATSGSATRTVSFNRNIAVAVTAPTTLASGTNTLAVALTCAYQLGATWSTAADCNAGPMNIDVGAGLTTATLGFGGTITAAAAANAVAGSYAGTINVVVTAR